MNYSLALDPTWPVDVISQDFKNCQRIQTLETNSNKRTQKSKLPIELPIARISFQCFCGTVRIPWRQASAADADAINIGKYSAVGLMDSHHSRETGAHVLEAVQWPAPSESMCLRRCNIYTA
jgi:hypothetical protein